MNRYSPALVAVAFLALTACSGEKAPTTGGVEKPSGGVEKPLAMKDVAAKVGCGDVRAGNLPLGTKEAAICKKGSHEVYLYTFDSDTSRDKWLKVARAGGALGTFEHGTSWVAQTV